MKTMLLLLLAGLLLFGCVQSGGGQVINCDGRALGESWQSEDGCNTCTCTENGVACTLMACVTPSPGTITGFEECTQAGYPVMESYPRQCRVPGGETFVEKIFSPNTACVADGDCQLVNEERGFSCCWTGACQTIDYASDDWIAANKDWFAQGRANNCPPTEACGPAPACPEKIVNVNYEAKCVANECQKVVVDACQDVCGDGECQEIVCMAIGCPCAETPESCPEDCA